MLPPGLFLKQLLVVRCGFMVILASLLIIIPARVARAYTTADTYLYGNSWSYDGHLGMQNITYDYSNTGWLTISFTYSMNNCCYASYPPGIYLSDGTLLTNPGIQQFLGQTPTDWYTIRTQFSNGSLSNQVAIQGGPFGTPTIQSVPITSSSSVYIYNGYPSPLDPVGQLYPPHDTVTLDATNPNFHIDTRDVPIFVSGQIPKQTVYLEFDASTVVLPNAGQYCSVPAQGSTPNFCTTSFQKPAANLTEAQREQIRSNIQSVFGDFLVDVTTTKPLSGDYTTIYVGGSRADWMYQPGVVGHASGIGDVNGYAIVFSDDLGSVDDLSQVIAHETGHLFGLWHETPTTELMYPFAGANQIGLVDQAVSRGEIRNGMVVADLRGATQNPCRELEGAVGNTPGHSCGGADSYTPFFDTLRLTLDNLFSTAFDARLAVQFSDDVLPIFFNLGDVGPGSIIDLNLPFYSPFRFFLTHHQ